MSDKADQFFKSMEEVAGETTERKQRTTNSNGSANTAGPEFFRSEEEKETPTEENTNPGGLTEEKIKASGRTGAILSGSIIETVFGLTNTVVFITKFKPAERKLITQLDEKAEADYSDEEKRVNRKFISLTKKFNETKTKIPLSQKEEDALAEGFSQYTRITGKSMNPQLIIWSTVIKVFVNRGIDIFM